MLEGFVVGKWNDPKVYAAVPCDKGLMIIHQGEQLKYCRTEQSARSFIDKHKKGKSLGKLPI
jgi:hypothetical protein